MEAFELQSFLFFLFKKKKNLFWFLIENQMLNALLIPGFLFIYLFILNLHNPTEDFILIKS